MVVGLRLCFCCLHCGSVVRRNDLLGHWEDWPMTTSIDKASVAAHPLALWLRHHHTCGLFNIWTKKPCDCGLDDALHALASHPDRKRWRDALRAVISHWDEFGPEHGFAELIDHVRREAISPDHYRMTDGDAQHLFEEELAKLDMGVANRAGKAAIAAIKRASQRQ